MFCHANRFRTGAGLSRLIAVVAAAVLLTSCGKKAEDADRAPGGTPQADTGPGEITSFRMDNGITVYLQEDHTQRQVAVEVLYRAGVVHEEKGYVHASRLLPHLMLFSATASFAPGEAVAKLSTTGRVNGEVVGEFTRFDYRALPDQLELIFQIEAERLTSVQFAEDQLELYAQKCADDVSRNFDQPNYALTKYGLMALNQAYNYGITEIPVYSGVRDLSIDDVQRYRRANYRLSNMVIVVVGDFDSGHATELIKNYFEGVTVEPLELTAPQPTGEDITAYWDIPATVFFLVYPGPYQDDRERIVLTMFGNFLTRQLKADEELLDDVKAIFCSGTTHPVGDTPFFVFLQIQSRRSVEDVRPAILATIDESLAMIDEKTFDTIKITLISYLESSLLKSQRNFSVTAHHKAMEQEAVNIAMRHFLRNGATTEQFVEMIRSITYEEARRYLDDRLASDNRQNVVIKSR